MGPGRGGQTKRLKILEHLVTYKKKQIKNTNKNRIRRDKERNEMGVVFLSDNNLGHKSQKENKSAYSALLI